MGQLFLLGQEVKLKLDDSLLVPYNPPEIRARSSAG